MSINEGENKLKFNEISGRNSKNVCEKNLLILEFSQDTMVRTFEATSKLSRNSKVLTIPSII
jgi:hypothetical protein